MHNLCVLVLIAILIGCIERAPTSHPTSEPTHTHTPHPTRTPRPAATPRPTHTPIPAPPIDWPTRLLSVSPEGKPDFGVLVRLSADARYVVYDSGFIIYLRDLMAATTTLLTVSPNGAPARGWSFAPSISSDGSTAAFISLAGNLLEPSQRQCPEEAICEGGALYFYDVATSALDWIPVGALESPVADTALSADGRWAAFAVPAASFREGVYLYDRAMDTLTTINPGDITSQETLSKIGGTTVDISADGRYVAFVSPDNGIVPDDQNGVSDVFVYDRDAGVIKRVSAPSDGIESNQPSGFQSVPNTGGAFDRGLSISADGRYVVFMSTASNLIDTYLPSCPHWPQSAEEFPACRHIYLYDRDTDMMELISVSSDGTPGNRASQDSDISADGRWVVFTSLANNLTADGPIACKDFSYDGFCPQVYVRDRQEGRTYLMSIGWDGLPAQAASLDPAITPDGRYVAFTSAAGNLANATFDEEQHNVQYTFITDLSALLDREK